MGKEIGIPKRIKGELCISSSLSQDKYIIFLLSQIKVIQLIRLMLCL